MKFDIKQTSNGWVVSRIGGTYEQHSHHNNLYGAKLVVSFIKKRELPKSNYLKGSCKRLLTETEYLVLRNKNKKKYINKRRN